MGEAPEHCWLPGCREIVVQTDRGGPRRKYCCTAHRASARRLRYDEQTLAESTLAVASLERQLAVIDSVRLRWEATPQSRRGAVPPAIDTLLAHASTLAAQLAELKATFAARRSRDAVQHMLAVIERRIAAIDRLLATGPGELPPTPERCETRQRLLADRELLVRERSRRRDELARLRSQLAAPTMPSGASTAS